MNDIFQPGNVILGTKNLEGKELRVLLILSVGLTHNFSEAYWSIDAIDENGQLRKEAIRFREQYHWIKLEL
jgi:hypothetical protein